MANAARPLIIHPVPTLDGNNTTCVDFNGTNESMGNNTDPTLGIGNTWSISFWAKPRDNVSAATFFHTVPTKDRINLYIPPLSPGLSDQLRVVLRNSSNPGVVFKHLGFVESGSYFFTDEVWTHAVVTWNGTDLKAYRDSVEAVITTTITDNSGTMTESARDIQFGGIDSEAGTTNLDGRLGHFAVWNSVLTQAEITKIFDGKFSFNLTFNNEDYVSAANLQHYWRPGAESGDIGRDYKGSIDIMQDPNNISSADIVTDSPT